MNIKTQAACEVAQLIAFHPSPEASERAYALIYAEREDTITAEERAELESHTMHENLMELAKIEAHLQLQQRAS